MHASGLARACSRPCLPVADRGYGVPSDCSIGPLFCVVVLAGPVHCGARWAQGQPRVQPLAC